MARTVGIGIQSFSELIEENYFYIDKTSFIKEWWESGDSVTLITRPRRFGKTLNMNMIETFFSVNYADRGDLFKELSIWQEEKYRKLQGTYPVISLSFAAVKESNYETANYRIRQLLMKQYAKYAFLQKSDLLSEAEKAYCRMMASEMNPMDAPMALYQLSDFLCRYYGKKVIILLDEYDTPMQEAYVAGYWNELIAFIRSLFNATFKTNPYLTRGIMTGITRVSKESVFSDLNNLEVITMTSRKYAPSFGFTEEEVFAALEEYDLGEKKTEVKQWYDGFVFGEYRDIYNPWSILNFLKKQTYDTYWANTSSNSLIKKLLQGGNSLVKTSFETLLKGGSIHCPIDEQIVYNRLKDNEASVWSLLVASGYLKVLSYERMENIETARRPRYELTITNQEVKRMFFTMIEEWFDEAESDYNNFVKALLLDDLDAMNEYMNEMTLNLFSYFDVGMRPSGRTEPERFYHGFVLGLMVELGDRYKITSNRESGFGRYDIMLEPLEKEMDAIIIEFKVFNARKEKNLEETLQNALQQIEDKKYAAELISRGIPSERIRRYGFAFEGKKVLIGSM